MNIAAINIAAIRRRWGMGQSAFGDLLKVSRNQVSNWERGRTTAPFEALLALQAATGIPVHRLSTEELPQESIPGRPFAPAPTLSIEDPLLHEMKAIRLLLEAILERLAKLPP